MENSAAADLLRREYRRGMTPPPRLSVPDWADRYRFLAPEAGSTQGKWKTSKVEVARGLMLAVTEPGVHTITAMTCTQLLKTAFLENTFGRFAHLDPCPMLLLQPKDDAVEQFSKERIAPFIRVTPVLRERVSTGTTRNSDETLKYKAFPGGFLAMASAGSPDNLARRPIRILLCDEVDKYAVSREGDPIALAEERTATFGANWLSIRACSPTVEDESRIAKSYEASDRRRASVVCPHCEHRQFLDFFKHVQWSKRENGTHDTKTARIHCESCGAAWSEGERLRALQTVRWHQTRPFECCGRLQIPLDAYAADGDVGKVWDWWEDTQEGMYAVYRAKCAHCGTWAVDNKHAGFQAGKLYSPWSKDRPADIAEKWIAAKGDHDLEMAWWNTQMGLPHRPNASKVPVIESLLARRENWGTQAPREVVAVTVGEDTQDYRVELEYVGWGVNEESWSLGYEVIEGGIDDPHVQEALDKALLRTFKRIDGVELPVLATGMDSGGHHTEHVYSFSKARLGRRVWALKGASEQNGQRNPVWPTKKPAKKTKASFRPIVIGGNAARDTIRNRLLLEPRAAGQPNPGYMHFGMDWGQGEFEQLTADRLVTREVGRKLIRVWETPRSRANERADCRVYAYAALCGLKHFGLNLAQLGQRLTVRAPEAPPEPPPRVVSPVETAETPPPQPAKSKRPSLVERMA